MINNVLFVAPITIGLIAGILAAVIAIVDSIVNNYGDVHILINGEKKDLTVKGGGSLLHLLSGEKIFIPSACGGRGSCGMCKAKVTSDIGLHLPTETPYMDQREIKDNVRLACQVKVKQDISIEIPEELFNVKEYTAK